MTTSLKALYILPKSSTTSAYSAVEFAVPADFAAPAALPKSISRRLTPGCKVTFRLDASKGNPVNETGLKAILRIHKECEVDLNEAQTRMFANTGTYKELLAYHGITS